MNRLTAVAVGEVLALLTACAGMIFVMYLSLRQRTPEALSADQVKWRLRAANAVWGIGLLSFLAIAVTFNVWPGMHTAPSVRRGSTPGPDIDLPVSTSSLFGFAFVGGSMCAGTSAFFFTRLFGRMRRNERGFVTQIGDIFLACLPLAGLIYTAGAFLLWLARVSGVQVGVLIETPPRWVMPALFGWLGAIFTIGYQATRALRRWRPN